jgi:hypothetical protein
MLTPLSNGLSNHEEQLLEVLYIDLKHQNQQQQLIRKIDNHLMADLMKLSYETWDTAILYFSILLHCGIIFIF